MSWKLLVFKNNQELQERYYVLTFRLCGEHLKLMTETKVRRKFPDESPETNVLPTVMGRYVRQLVYSISRLLIAARVF